MSLPKPYLSKFFVLVRVVNKCQKIVPCHGALERSAIPHYLSAINAYFLEAEIKA